MCFGGIFKSTIFLEGASGLIFEQLQQDTESINEVDGKWLYKPENLQGPHLRRSL